MRQILIFAIVMVSITWLAPAVAEVGYKRSAWGSKTWTGPGPPPHWSPKPSPPQRPIDPEWGVRPPSHRPYRRSRVYYYSQKPVSETIIIEQEKQVPSAPVRRQLSPLRCGGETVTRNDPLTGELVIEYVTGSRSCPE